MVFGIIFGVSFGLRANLFRGLVAGLFIGGLNALLFIFLNWMMVYHLQLHRKKTASFWKSLRLRCLSILGKRPIYGFFFGILNGWLRFSLGRVSASPLFDAIYDGIWIGVVYMLLGRLHLEIHPAERVSWSWKKARRVFMITLPLGVLAAILIEIFSASFFVWLFPKEVLLDFSSSVFLFLALGLSTAIGIAVASGITSDLLDHRDRIYANQGIWNSVKISLLLALAYGLLFGSAVGGIELFGTVFLGRRAGWLALGIAFGIAAAGVIFALRGGFAGVKHLLLRWLLSWRGVAPFHYPRFLNTMVDRNLLRRVGGGYSFVHRRLLDYFADASSSTVEKIAASEATNVTPPLS